MACLTALPHHFLPSAEISLIKGELESLTKLISIGPVDDHEKRFAEMRVRVDALISNSKFAFAVLELNDIKAKLPDLSSPIGILHVKARGAIEKQIATIRKRCLRDPLSDLPFDVLTLSRHCLAPREACSLALTSSKHAAAARRGQRMYEDHLLQCWGITPKAGVDTDVRIASILHVIRNIFSNGYYATEPLNPEQTPIHLFSSIPFQGLTVIEKLKAFEDWLNKNRNTAAMVPRVAAINASECGTKVYPVLKRLPISSITMRILDDNPIDPNLWKLAIKDLELTNMSSIPPQIASLKQLRNLSILSCTNVVLPKGIAGCPIEHLILSEVTNIPMQQILTIYTLRHLSLDCARLPRHVDRASLDLDGIQRLPALSNLRIISSEDNVVQGRPTVALPFSKHLNIDDIYLGINSVYMSGIAIEHLSEEQADMLMSCSKMMAYDVQWGVSATETLERHPRLRGRMSMEHHYEREIFVMDM